MKIWVPEWQAAGPLWEGLGLEALAMAPGRIDCGLWWAGVGLGGLGRSCGQEGRRTRSSIRSVGIGK